MTNIHYKAKWHHDKINVKLTNTIQNKLFCLPATSITPFASNTPEFGRTQYFFGAVVLILKQTFFSDGFINFM
jgi:hypothetical protein